MVGKIITNAASVSHRLLEDLTEDTSASGTDEKEFNPVVFWSVNALWMSVLVASIIWFCKFKGAERMTQWATNASRSDDIFAQRLRRRREAAAEAKRISPEVHRAELKKQFRNAKVHMVSLCSQALRLELQNPIRKK